MSRDRFAWKATDVRMRHVINVFSVLQHHQATRAEIATMTGVSQATISTMIGQAMDLGLVTEGEGRIIRFSSDLPKTYGISVVSRDVIEVVEVDTPRPTHHRVLLTDEGAKEFTLPPRVWHLITDLHQETGPYLPRFTIVASPSTMKGWEGLIADELGPEYLGYVQETGVCSLAAVEAVTRRQGILSINRCPKDGWLASSFRRSWSEPPESLDLRHYLVSPGRGPRCSVCGRQGCLQSYIESPSEDAQAQSLVEAFSPLVASLDLQTVVMSGFSDRVIDLVDRSLEDRLWGRASIQVAPSPFGAHTFGVGAAMWAFKWWFVRALTAR